MDCIADVLEDLIDESGMSLRSLAKASGVSSTQYSDYLRNSIPTIKVADRICKYFKCSFDYLCGLDDKRFGAFGDYDPNKFLSRYNDFLKENNISNWKLAKSLGFSESCMRHWCCGQVPRLDVIIKIAYKFSISIDYLLGRTDKK